MAHVRAFIGVCLLTLTTAAYTTTTAFATEREAGSLAANEAHHSVILSLMNEDVQTVALESLDRLVAEGVEALQEAGFAEEAHHFATEWTGSILPAFSALGTMGVGDHAPLNLWLENFTAAIHRRIGEQAYVALHLDDIENMNFAIPVVFQPAGDRRNFDQWDKVEYRTHFIPFAGIATYWGAYYGCQYAAKKQKFLKNFCKRIAGTLRQAMELRFAPMLSDRIYDRALAHSAMLD